MAKLPDITEDRQVVQAGVNSGINPTQMGISPVTEAMDKLGGSFIVAGHAVKQAEDKRDKFNYYTAKSNFLRQNIELENKIQNDPDYQNLGTKYTEEVAKIKANTLGELGNNVYAKHLAADIDLDTTQSLVRVGNVAHKRQEEVARGSLIDTIDANQKALLQTANEGQRASLIHSTNDAIQSTLEAGAINEEQATKLRSKATEDYAQNRLALLTPYQQIAALNPKRGANGELYFPKKNNYVDFLSPDKKISFFDSATNAIKAVKEKEIDTSMVDLALQNKVVLDPTLPQNQKAVDVVWADRQQNLMNQGASKEQILNSSLDMVAKIGMIPSPVKSVLTANILNGDVNQKATYSKYIGDAADLNPKVLNGLDNNVVATSIAISNNLRSGLSAQQAVEWVNKYQDQAKKESIESKKNAWENLNKKSFKNNDANIVSKFQDQPGFDLFSTKAAIPQPMIDDYKRLSKGFYANDNLDNASANSAAEKMVRAQWGITEIGGQKKYMKYAPEIIYGNQDNWVHKQLEEDFKTPIKDVALEVNYATINTPTPSYFVYKNNPFGGVDIVLDEKNMPKQFIPKYHQANTEKIIEALKDAQDEREKALVGQEIRNLLPLGR